MNTTGDVQELRFKSPESADRRWLEWYREEFSRRMFGVDIEPEADTPFRIDKAARILPELSLSTGRASPMRTVARNSGDGVFVMTIALEGKMSAVVGSEHVGLKPGAAFFGKPTMLETHSDTQVLSVRLSPRLLSPLVPNLAALTAISIPAASQPLRLLTGYVRMLDAEQAINGPEASHLVTMHVHELAALAIGATRSASAEAVGSVRAARLVAVKQDILSNLTDPRLSVATVAARHGLSPRYVHKLFESEGVSFTEYVLRRRLQQAHNMLSDPRFAGTSIGTIAFAVGFGDLSYFNRTFRRHFGATPSEVREQGR